MSSPLITGVHACMLGVREFGPTQRILQQAMEWELIGEAELNPELCDALWNIPSRAQVRALAPADSPSGRIHLLRFPEAQPQSPGRVGARVFGFRAMNCYTRDMAEIRARVLAAGADWGDEVQFDIDMVDGTTQTVHQGRAVLPDDAAIVFVITAIPRDTETWSRNPAAYCPELTSVVAASPDADASKRFWGPEGMGFEIRYDLVQSNPETNRMIGLEPDASVRVVFGWGQTTSRVEILGRVSDRYEQVESVDLTPIQRPGLGLGPVGWVVKVEDLDQALKQLEQVGGRVIAGPVEASNELHGKRRVATLRTPEGTWLSVWGAAAR